MEKGDVEKSPNAMVVEAHEEFVQHIENGQGRIRALSILTMAVGVLLLASYFSQILYPFVTGQTTVQVNLLDPTLIVFEIVLIVLTFAWLYVGVINYLFSSRLGRMIRNARAAEKELGKRITG